MAEGLTRPHLPLEHHKPPLRLSCRCVTWLIEAGWGQGAHKPQGQADGLLGLKATSRFNKSAVHNLEGWCLCWLMAHLATTFVLVPLRNEVSPFAASWLPAAQLWRDSAAVSTQSPTLWPVHTLCSQVC